MIEEIYRECWERELGTPKVVIQAEASKNEELIKR